MKTLPSDRHRIFIVGCARSGTTLLQSILASNKAIASFPETHFFRGTIPKYRVLQWFKFYSKKDQEFVRHFLKKIQREDLYEAIPRQTANTARWVAEMLDLIDRIPEDNQTTAWIEKTPMHLYFIPLIQHADPNTKFIHVLREGKDVVASLYEASQQYPDSFGGKQSVQDCIKRWKRDIKIHKQYINQPNHFYITYNDLLNNASHAISGLCNFIDVRFSEDMLSFSKKTKALKFEEEQWKPDSSDEIKATNKFGTIFSAEQKEYILTELSSVTLDDFTSSL